MLLGKRQRAPRMRRTTSTSEFSLDSHHLDSPSDPTATGLAVALPMTAAQRRHSGERLETAHFLRACGFCNRRLAPGKDIYMYMGDTAFCSLECREQGMNQEEGKDKCSNWASVNKAASSSRGSKASNKGETSVAAA